MMGVAADSGYREQPFILHDSASQYHWTGVGSASIKTFWGGKATYRLERGTERICAGQFLLLNDGQPYEITIDDRKTVESFCVFFPTGMAMRTAKEVTINDSARLDNPYGQGYQEWTFLDRVYSTDIRIMARLDYIRRNISTFRGDQLWIDQQVSLLMENLVGLHSGIMTAMQRIPAARKATRDELTRRVLIAHEWIRASYREDVTLGEMARTAGLSPNHLIRSYRQVFGVTPHQHVVELRLREAAHLLRHRRDLSVLAVCTAAGFESPSTFSGTFRRKTGISPLEYRQGQQFGDFEEDSSLTLIYTR